MFDLTLTKSHSVSVQLVKTETELMGVGGQERNSFILVNSRLKCASFIHEQKTIPQKRINPVKGKESLSGYIIVWRKRACFYFNKKLS